MADRNRSGLVYATRLLEANTLTAVPAPAEPIRVRVRPRHRVIHEATVYTGGDILTVPADELHRAWLRDGYVERVETTEPKGKTK